MKLLICGKGGSGKSTLAVLLARSFAQMGRNVLLVDADESNQGLHRMAGADKTVTLLEYLGGRKGLRPKRLPEPAGPACPMFYDRPFSLAEIPEACISIAGGVRLIKVGKIQRFEEGCACPMGGMLRQLLTHIRLGPEDRLIIDTAAGLEHFGRGVERFCDRIVGVIDPSFESFKLAREMDRIAGDAGLAISFVLNKADERVRTAMGDYVDPDRIIGDIPMSDVLFTAGLHGEPLDHPVPEASALCRRLEAERPQLSQPVSRS
ncbi:MAG: P-loop NTPase [Desulfobacterales bacterium]